MTRISVLLLVALCIAMHESKLIAADNEIPARALLQKHCLSCHGPEEVEGKFDLRQFPDNTSMLRQRNLWLDVIVAINSKEMPPKKAKSRPTETERKVMTEWAQQVLQQSRDCSGPQNPGRVTHRQLTGNEYNNTIRDLIGFDLRPMTVRGNAGAGFLNNASAMAVTPLVFDEFFAAAEIVVATVLGPASVAPAKQRTPQVPAKIVPVKLVGTATTKDRDVVIAHNIKQAGPQHKSITLELFGKTHNGFIPIKADSTTCHLSSPQQSINVPWRLLSDEQICTIATPTILTGSEETQKSFLILLGANREKHALFQPLSLQLMGLSSEELVPKKKLATKSKEAYEFVVFAYPDKTTTPRQAAEKVLRKFAFRAYRRPVTDAEILVLLTGFDAQMKSGKSYDEALRPTLEAVLVSAQFLMRIEPNNPSAGSKPYHLDGWAIASRLSYLIWSSMPDETLFAAAREGKLATHSEIEIQVKRMLADPRSEALVNNFFTQWLGLDAIGNIRLDSKVFPEFDRDLRNAMTAEPMALFRSIIRDDGSLLALLDTDTIYVNETLAKHYGMKGVTGPELRQVNRPDLNRGGLMGMAGILALTSHSTRTNFSARGAWVLDTLLGTPPPPPPADVPQLPEGELSAGKMTVRQIAERHRSDSACASCHAKVDPIGLALENFDAAGAWRVNENGQKIDATGTMPDGTAIDGPATLRAAIMQRKQLFARHMTELMLQYALGRSLTYDDACAIEEIKSRLEKNNFRFSDLVIGVAQSVPFTQKQNPMATAQR